MKKFLSIVLSIAMILGTMSTVVFAESNGYVTIEGDATNTQYATIDEAIAAGGNATYVISGTVAMNGGFPGNAEMTFKGDGNDETIDGIKFAIGSANWNQNRHDAHYGEIVFDGLTLDWTDGGYYQGIAHAAALTYNECVINGTVYLYAGTETFTGCVFNKEAVDYNVYVRGSGDTFFTDCIFNCEGKSICIYNEGNGINSVNFDGCDFVANASSDGKAAIEIDSTFFTDEFEVNISDDCTVAGFDNGTVSGDTLVNNKKGDNVAVKVGDEYVTGATVDGVYYASVYDAIEAAQPGQTVELLGSVYYASYFYNGNWYDKWDSIWNKNDVTINGNGYTVKVDKVDSNVNGGGLLLDAENITISDLTVALPSDSTGEMERLATMKSGTLNNVTVNGGAYGVSVVGEGPVVINECDFVNIEGWAVETEAKPSNGTLTISDSTFDEKAVILRGENNTFTGNEISGTGEGVNVLGDAVITGNYFGDSTLGIDSGVDVIIENNSINNVELSTWLVPSGEEPDYSSVTIENNTLSDEALETLKSVDEDVVSVDPVVQVGGKGYYSLEAAAEANDVAGQAVVIEILDDITLDSGIMFTEATDVTINGNGHTITMIDNPDGDHYSNPFGKDARPTGFSISKDNYSVAAGSVFNIEDMTIVNEKTMNRYSSGHSWRAAYYAYAYAETVNYNGVDFIGGVAVDQNASFVGCTFTENRENMFMVFVDQEYSEAGAESAVTVDNCSFDFQGDAYGTFKIANKDGQVDLSVTDSEFLNSANIPAITVDTNVDATVEDCVFENCKAGAYGSEAWVNGGPVPAVPTSGSLNGVKFGATGSTIEDLGDVEELLGDENEVHSGSVEVVFERISKTEEDIIYNINLVASNNGIINRLNSADLTFALTPVTGENEFEIIASNSDIVINPVDNSKTRYEFHYKNKDNTVTSDTAKVITIGQVKFTGYGKFDFAVDATATTNAAHATTLYDNIVESFIPNGEDGVQLGELVVENAVIDDAEITVPTRELTINIKFPNTVVDQTEDYQNMTVSIVGGTYSETVELGGATGANAEYTIEKVLPYNTPYTVTVSGAGYRTARYTVTLNDHKTLNFWNNVKDADKQVEVETGIANSATTKNFLAGDIVKDNNINIYDLSAVVSYFNTATTTSAYDANAKYDLNRDGIIDSKDVAYVLVSWGE